MKQLTIIELKSVSGGGFFRDAWDKIKDAFEKAFDRSNKSPTENAKDACKVIGFADGKTSVPNAGRAICDRGVNTIGKYKERQREAMSNL